MMMRRLQSRADRGNKRYDVIRLLPSRGGFECVGPGCLAPKRVTRASNVVRCTQVSETFYFFHPACSSGSGSSSSTALQSENSIFFPTHKHACVQEIEFSPMDIWMLFWFPTIGECWFFQPRDWLPKLLIFFIGEKTETEWNLLGAKLPVHLVKNSILLSVFLK